ncbi:AIR synthase-related protein, partial [Escherichia coli]|nr:AIR synthase-related protein [Escherichia coli]
DLIAILGVTRDDLAAGEYAQAVENWTTEDLIANGVMPEIDLALERKVQNTVLNLADEMLLKSAHDCSDGGLAVAIAECC